ncbi:MAG: DCC1-like thiol-disulfide oxidoreductase family protein [Akkermansiaceae bacterium]
MGWVLFFDGECGFCKGSAKWAARFDKRERVSFAPLQGKLAAENNFTQYAEQGAGTMVLLREADGKFFLRSDAAIELARALGGAWRIFLLARLIPKPLRDAVYRWVARNRSHFASLSDTCVLPDPELRKRLRE